MHLCNATKHNASWPIYSCICIARKPAAISNKSICNAQASKEELECMKKSEELECARCPLQLSFKPDVSMLHLHGKVQA